MPNQLELLGSEYELNEKDGTLAHNHQVGMQLLRLQKRAMVATYDFAVLGGAVGAVNLKNPIGMNATLPKGALITGVYIDVLTGITSGGSATIAIGAAAANDLKAATAYTSFASGIVAGVPVSTAATAIKLAADATLTATIATAALTAGKLSVCIEYFVSST